MVEANHHFKMRARIMQLILRHPGLHLREIARQLATSVALVEYHVPHLVAEGEAEMVADHRLHRLYPANFELPHAAVASLRDGKRLRIALQLLSGPQTHTQLVASCGFGKSTLSFHLRKLEAAKLIKKRTEGYALLNPDSVRTIIENAPPTQDLLNRFSDLWGDLYRPKF